MTKVRIACPWDTSENITNRLLCQFKTPEISLTGIKFVYDDSYDVAVCFNHICLEIDKNYYALRYRISNMFSEPFHGKLFAKHISSFVHQIINMINSLIITRSSNIQKKY